MLFPLIKTIVNCGFVFGVVIVLYELGGAPARWGSAIVSWVLFCVNLYTFIWIAVPKMNVDLGGRFVVYRFIDMYLSLTLSNAALGFSIWVLDTSPGKAAQFQALGDETISGYLAFLRIWVSYRYLAARRWGSA